MQKVTACIITWKRQNNLPEIVGSLTRWPFIAEILIRDNSKMENTINYGRYQLARAASNDIIYTQDDDCVIENLDEVYEKFMSDPTKICHSGIYDYQIVIPENIYGERQMAMFGWGAFFNKEWISVLNKYTDKHGTDHCFMRETDRIFSILKGGHHNFVLGNIKHMGRFDSDALSNRSDHLEYKKLSIDRALSC